MIEANIFKDILNNTNAQAVVFAVSIFSLVTALHFKFWHLYPQK